MIFIETGAFIGRYLPDDQHHAAALAGWAYLTEQRMPCYTSNLVLSETITLLARRARLQVCRRESAPHPSFDGSAHASFDA